MKEKNRLSLVIPFIIFRMDVSGWKKSLTGYANETVIGKYKFVGKDLGKMSKSAVDSAFQVMYGQGLMARLLNKGLTRKILRKDVVSTGRFYLPIAI